jgi:exodeoxyribonuclease-3
MKLVSFNVNGIRASVKKGLAKSLSEMNADIVCFQETKANPDQVAEALADVKGYHLSAYSAEKAGYSGTAILSREAPVRVDHGIGGDDHNAEGPRDHRDVRGPHRGERLHPQQRSRPEALRIPPTVGHRAARILGEPRFRQAAR